MDAESSQLFKTAEECRANGISPRGTTLCESCTAVDRVTYPILSWVRIVQPVCLRVFGAYIRGISAGKLSASASDSVELLAGIQYFVLHTHSFIHCLA